MVKCENPRCCNCVTEMTLSGVVKRYCSTKCCGVHNSLKSREKAKQTMLARHGVEQPMHSTEIKEKRKQTMLARHGVEQLMHSTEIKEKRKQTIMSRLGVEHVFQSEEIKEKRKQTMLTRHGVEQPMHSTEIKEKRKQTNVILYGVEYPFQSETIKEKVKQTNMNLYGSSSYANKHIPQEIKLLINNIDWLHRQNETKTLGEIAHDLNMDPSLLSRRFKKFNIPVKHHFKSYFEKQVFEFVQSIYPNIIQNDRKQIKPFELDIWFPDLNIAIECNGRYYHQDQEKEINKFNKCKDKGIDLYFIWDDEWYADKTKAMAQIYDILSPFIKK